MAQPVQEVHAPTLTDEQTSIEVDWLRRFSEASDRLDWAEWEIFWDDSAVLQFNNTKIEGKIEIGKYFEQQFSRLQSMTHVITRLSFVTPPGLVFQNADVSYKVKGDRLDRTLNIPGVAIIHKKPRTGLLTKFETYIDTSSLISVIEEVSKEALA
ncbi:hypothetical protein RhiJN_13482 [Ceratobasidium sp. AG-Ba]|nr:hypothetical protein RhiJN_13482 [Ceratobasidium sp. AG-Ba]QRW14033.1 hypothetical protein RhiLY_13032 [Ceratobasidium sp. AG-Ba]